MSARPRRVPTERTYLAVIAAAAAAMRADVHHLVEALLVQQPAPATSAATRTPTRSDAPRKMARHRELNPNCTSSCCAGRRKPSPVSVLVPKAGSAPTPVLRGQTARAAKVTRPDTSNPSLPRSPSFPEQQKLRTKRPSAAKPARGPVLQLGSIWGKTCTAAGFSSRLGNDGWRDLRELLFGVCGKDLERAGGLVREYIRSCALSNQKPSTPELLDYAHRLNGGGIANRQRLGAAQLHISDQARREHAVPGRKALSR